MRKWTATAICALLSVVSWFVWWLVKNAVAGWLNTQLEARWEMIDPATQDSLLFIWFPPIVLTALIGVGFWVVYRLGIKEATFQPGVGIDELLAASNFATSNDVELFRRNLFFIKERITSYERFDDYKDEYYKRFASIKNADLTIFTNENINQWRRDFLNRVGILADEKSNPLSDRTEEARVKSELLAIWKCLDDALS